MRSNILETTVGTFVLLVASYFFYYAYSASAGAHRLGYELRADFDRVDGLSVGNDVKMSGVMVGSVSHIAINPSTYMAHVTLKIDPAIKLPTDSAAEIVSESLMGGKYVALVPGGDDKFLESEGKINYTQSAVSWESLIGKFLFSKSDDKKNDKIPEQS